MAITRVQYKTGTSNGDNATLTFSMDTAPTNGNILILAFGSYNVTSISSITQTGVTWSSVRDQVGTTSLVGLCAIWKGIVGSDASASLTIDVNDGSSQFLAACVCEYSGLSGEVDGVNSANSGSVASLSTGSADVTVSGSLAIVAADTYSTGIPTADNDFSLIARYNSVGHGAYFERNNVSTGSISSTVSLSPNDFLTLCIAVFKPEEISAGQQLFTLINDIY